MKKAFLFLLVLTGLSVSLFAQSEKAKVVVLINSASWCPACKEHGPRVEKNIVPDFMETKACEIVVNDLTDENSKAKSAESLLKAGVLEFANENKMTGMIYFIDAKTKQLISSISVAKTDDEIKKALKDVLAKG